MIIQSAKRLGSHAGSSRYARSLGSALAGACALAASPAHPAYPERPVRLIVPLAAGGGTDIVARVFAQMLSDRWGQQVVVDNRPGASGVIGAELVAKAAPDGYTLAMMSSSFTVFPSLHRKLPYDTVKDFSPVTMLVSYPFLLVAHPTLAAASVKDLVAAAKAKPGHLTYASSGSGSAAHLASELFKSMSGANITHVPYKGSGPAVTGLLSGESLLGFYSASAVGQHIKSGRLKVIATTSEKRFRAFPDLPTIAEAGVPGYEASTWAGLIAPAGLPNAILDRLHREYVAVLGIASVRDRLAALEFEPVGNSPAEFTAIIRNEIVKWAKVVRDSGAKVD